MRAKRTVSIKSTGFFGNRNISNKCKYCFENLYHEYSGAQKKIKMTQFMK